MEYIIEIDTKTAGDLCPCCNKGKLYPSEARKMVQFTGNAAVNASRYKKAVLRCNGCGREVMKAKSIRKWEASARSSIVLQKVNGMPFHRLSQLQSYYNIPIAPSTLWQQCSNAWEDCGKFIAQELLKEAGECKTFYTDDTRAKVLEIIAENQLLPKEQRRSSNTTVICCKTKEGHNIVNYITDSKYSGENMAPIISNRSNSNHRIRIVADASSQNIPAVSEEEKKKLIIANCLAHARRKFYDLLEFYPKECSYFLKEIAAIYRIDDECRDYRARKRLKHHKRHSSIHINNIYKEINRLFREKLIEPNSALGKAMRYWLRHKEGLTKFLSIKGIALDNNRSEQALRKIILQRKNSLFFKTRSSAAVLSGFSSITKTCEANDINSYGYLNWIQEHWKQVQESASDYLPWKYKEYLNNTELIVA